MLDATRRQFLQKIGLAATGTAIMAAAPTRALALNLPASRVQWVGEARDITLYNPNTHERINTVFFAHGQYNRQSYNQLCHFLRDHHQNVAHWMDPKLLTLLHDIQCVFDKREIEIISGYRTERTQRWLRGRMPGVAKDSFHVRGQAADIRLRGVSVASLRDVAKVLAVGGVGYYPRAHFIHVDTGPIRVW